MEFFGGQIRWVPTEHMLSDALTKRIPTDLIIKFMKDNRYSFTYSDEITPYKCTEKRARAKKRKAKIEDNKAKALIDGGEALKKMKARNENIAERIVLSK